MATSARVTSPTRHAWYTSSTKVGGAMSQQSGVLFHINAACEEEGSRKLITRLMWWQVLLAYAVVGLQWDEVPADVTKSRRENERHFRSIDRSLYFFLFLFVSFSNLPRTFKKRVLFLMRSHSWSESPGAHSNEQRHFRDQRFDAWELVWNRHCSCGRSFGETEVIGGWGPGRGWAEWRWIGREALPWRNGNDRWLPSWHGGLSQSHRQTGKPLVTDWSWCGVSRA